ncbi:MAG: hypothetical protein H6738_07245 [Alphaproteobacteria bacterium]|nr:hypothetical protein [Alphaproteobacteria bacterium]MCB9696558.1 hypothetical protein [Alphaproteobacteria bacterium]
MTLSRRSFTFASLVAAMSPRVAHAGKRSHDAIPEVEEAQQQVLAQADPSAAPRAFEVKVQSSVERGVIEVSLHLTNVSDERIDVMSKVGSRSAGDVRILAEVDGQSVYLQHVLSDVDRREMMSRMGPLPRFEAVKPKASLVMGPYRFTVPQGARPPFTLDVSIVTSADEVTVHVDDLALGATTVV